MIRNPDVFARLLAEVRQFVRDECMPLENEIDQSDEIPAASSSACADRPVRPQHPRGLRRRGAHTEELSLVNIEVSQCATTFRARFGGNTGIASESMVVDGTEAQKKAWLPRLASGEITGCFALTEPEAGSDATALTTTRRARWRRLSDQPAEVLHHQCADRRSVHRVRRTDPPRKAPPASPRSSSRAARRACRPAAYRKMGQHGSPVGEVVLEALPCSGFGDRRRTSRARASARR